MYEANSAATAVSAEALRTVSIEIDHLEIAIIMLLDDDQAIRPNAKTSIADLGNWQRICVQFTVPVIDDHEIISRSLVFLELDLPHF